MAETRAARDEGLSHLESFIALLTSTRGSLAESQDALEARSEALSEQVGSSTGRLQVFHETLLGLVESLQGGIQAALGELAHLTQTSAALGAEIGGTGAQALQASTDRFTLGVESARAGLERGSAELIQAFNEVEQGVDTADEHTAGLVAEEDAGFVDLATAVAEADTLFHQAEFDLQGAIDTTTGYLLEGLEQYLARVFDAFFDHLENEAQPYLIDMFQELGRSLHRTLDDYDASVESVTDDLIGTTEPAMADVADRFHDQEREKYWERARTLELMASFSEELGRGAGSVGKFISVSTPYPPIIPTLAAAKEVAERVQEMMDVFNPFG